MLSRRAIGAVATLLLGTACSGQTTSGPQRQEGTRALAPTPPLRVPELPETGERDQDGNHLDDSFDERLVRASSDSKELDDVVALEVILTSPVEQADLDGFVADGGRVRYVFREISYGFTGSIALGKLKTAALLFGDRLHLVAAPSRVVTFMDEATRTGRVRAIWASNFAGNAPGYSGNDNITIAVLDTGVDSSHTDLSGRMQGFKDYTTDAAASARDVGGHGTHVTAIVVGSGAAFGSSTASLKYTQSGTMTGVGAGAFSSSTVHTPAYLGGAATLTLSTSATFLGGASTTLHALRAPDGSTSYTSFGSVSGSSPLSLNSQNGGTSGMICQGGLVQSNPAAITNFAVTSTVANYPSVGDGFNALRGVAPSCRYFGAKVFTDVGTASSLDIAEALDDLVVRKSSDNIKVANLSLGVTGSGTDTVLRARVNTTVDAGIVVVVAAGNDGPSTTMGDPARASKVITVGAANDVNELTRYTSVGFASPGATEDTKPDVLAPGGSAYRSMILAADTNTADGNSSSFGDVVANDYASLQGTSMAAPFTSGSVALLIDALQQSGTTWSFASSAQPLFVKMLLLASATEINGSREQGSVNPPTLGRAATPKDIYEGYGILNPDAAIEAMVQTFASPLAGSVSNTSPARLEWERRAWGRKLSLVNGSTVALTLAVPSTADYDVYVYGGAADSKGNPVVRASSVNAGNDSDETVSFTSTTTETAYVFVKRISGYGAFSLSGAATSHCGDGDVDTGEQCDPAAANSSTCCTSYCTTVTNGTSCTDGSSCTQTDSCQSGVCAGSNPVTCTASDQCHDAGTCSPATGLCSNPSKTNGTTCSDGNKCTQTDTCQTGVCTGSNPVTCTASDQCHDAGSCDTGTGVCSNPSKTNGTSCSDGNKCTQTDTCQTGVCTGSNPVTCTASDQCHDAGSCDAGTGVCSNPSKTNGTTCSDGDKCTQNDTCQAGACSAGAAVTCTASDQCHTAGTCDSGTGVCSNPAKTDGTTCSDGDQCTQTDTCQAGSCTGSNAVTCTASDQCHDVGTCAPATGVCSNPAKTNGTSCSDGDQCTQTDTCQAGSCAGSNAVTCTASDQCHTAGTCDSGTGMCSNPAKTDGASCSDGDKCTQTDTCQAGACTGNSPVVCSASDQCHDPGSCNPSTGACSNPAKNDGSTCSDGSLCTQSDSCQSGVCTGGTVVSCTASDQCHDAGSCDPGTGACSNPAKTNGTSCSDGDKCTTGDACQAGTCTAGSAVTCAASDQCHDVGSCDPGTGVCSNPAKTNGTSCSDGDKCTQLDTCQGGACTGASPVLCAASDQCHDVGSCNPSTGACSNPAKTDGTGCSDGNACSQTDTCQSGVCAGANPVVCTALDQCHDVGACDAATGACTTPAKGDGASCNDGNGCTLFDACVAGACVSGSAVTCLALDQCHSAGVCDPASGLCSNPSVGDGAPCSDADACSLGDACEMGFCVASSDKTCDAPDACHEIGVCAPATGACSFVARPDGTPCAENSECEQGVCVELPDGAGGAGGEGGGSSGAGPTGGAPTGGAPMGGATSGGMPSGGATSGGMPSGGATSGGMPSGGATSGGMPSGGGPMGGAPMGGVAGSALPGDGGVAGGDGVGPGEGGTDGGVTPSEGGGDDGSSAGTNAKAGGSSIQAPDKAPPRSKGCGCAVPGSDDSSAPYGVMLGLAAMLAQRARRRRAA